MKKEKTNILWWVLVILAVILTSLYFTEFRSRVPPVSVPRENVNFRNDGRLYFINPDRKDTLAGIDIEMADNDQSRARGLMDRDSLGFDRGMLFIYQQAQVLNYWMKNTRISLDIVFVGYDRKVKYIASHATPYSTNPITGFYPAQYVIEVNAGFCDSHNIKAGVLIEF